MLSRVDCWSPLCAIQWMAQECRSRPSHGPGFWGNKGSRNRVLLSEFSAVRPATELRVLRVGGGLCGLPAGLQRPLRVIALAIGFTLSSRHQLAFKIGKTHC
jgi:hypothetical protein